MKEGKISDPNRIDKFVVGFIWNQRTEGHVFCCRFVIFQGSIKSIFLIWLICQLEKSFRKPHGAGLIHRSHLSGRFVMIIPAKKQSLSLRRGPPRWKPAS